MVGMKVCVPGDCNEPTNDRKAILQAGHTLQAVEGENRIAVAGREAGGSRLGAGQPAPGTVFIRGYPNIDRRR